MGIIIRPKSMAYKDPQTGQYTEIDVVGGYTPIVSTETKYQVSNSGTTVPTGTWLENIPTVPQGNFLWMRTALRWNNGVVSYLYSATRQGRDGLGSVSSVNSIGPDENGNVTIPIDAAPTDGSSNPVSSNGVYDALAGKQDTLTIDAAPTDGSSNPVSSNGVFDALAGKQDTLTIDAAPTAGSSNPVSSGGTYTALAGKQDTLTFDDAPTAGSNNPVKSGALKAALDEKIASLGENLITSVSDDTVAYWRSKGPGYVYFNVADCLHGQPYRYGFLVSYVRGPNVYQEFYSTNDFTGPYYRFANTSQTAMPSFEAKTKEGSITFASGIASSSDTRYPTKVFRNGNVICLQAAVQTTDDSNFSSTYRELFTLPVGYRPAYRIMAAGCVGSGIWNLTFTAKINIDLEGVVSVYIPSTSATNANSCQFCVSFIV